MFAQQLTQEAMALPLPERVLLVQVLWDSIHGSSEQEDLDETLYQELKAGAEALPSDFFTFDVEVVIQQARDRHAAQRAAT